MLACIEFACAQSRLLHRESFPRESFPREWKVFALFIVHIFQLCTAKADSTPHFDAANDTWKMFISRVNKKAFSTAKKSGSDHEAALKAGRDAAERVSLHYSGEDVC